jgi:hypothetical protein
MWGARAPTDGPDGVETAPGAAAGGVAEAAAPTALPQSMQNRDSDVFERPQNAQTVKREPPGNTPVRRVNIRPGQHEEQ